MPNLLKPNENDHDSLYVVFRRTWDTYTFRRPDPLSIGEKKRAEHFTSPFWLTSMSVN